MAKTEIPFPLPKSIESPLARVLAYWESLKRGENNMPFWDDVSLSALPELADGLTLIDAFSRPERFRFNAVGSRIAQQHGDALAGKFADDLDLRHPLRFVRAQCSATVEARCPTYFRDSGAGSSRLLMPMWGDGRVSMLLGAVAWHPA